MKDLYRSIDEIVEQATEFASDVYRDAYDAGYIKGLYEGNTHQSNDRNYQEGVIDGRQEMLNVISEIRYMNRVEREKYFGQSSFLSILEMSVDEMIKGYAKAYADIIRKDIKVGTEVTWEDNGKKRKGAVYLIDQNDDCHIMSKDDDYIVGIECLKPTGRHYPEISNVLCAISIEDGGEDD